MWFVGFSILQNKSLGGNIYLNWNCHFTMFWIKRFLTLSGHNSRVTYQICDKVGKKSSLVNYTHSVKFHCTQLGHCKNTIEVCYPCDEKLLEFEHWHLVQMRFKIWSVSKESNNNTMNFDHTGNAMLVTRAALAWPVTHQWELCEMEESSSAQGWAQFGFSSSLE